VRPGRGGVERQSESFIAAVVLEAELDQLRVNLRDDLLLGGADLLLRLCGTADDIQRAPGQQTGDGVQVRRIDVATDACRFEGDRTTAAEWIADARTVAESTLAQLADQLGYGAQLVPRCAFTSSQMSSRVLSGNSSGRKQWRNFSSRPILAKASASMASRSAEPLIQLNPFSVLAIARDQRSSGSSSMTRGTSSLSKRFLRFSKPSSSISISLRKMWRSRPGSFDFGISRPRTTALTRMSGLRPFQYPPSAVSVWPAPALRSL
jgi:hypothetical protein